MSAHVAYLPADYFDPPDPVDDDERERDAQAKYDADSERGDNDRKERGCDA